MYYKENTQIYLDREFKIHSDAHAGLYDQTLHYGYGVFEGIRSYNTSKGRQIFKANDHFERLKRSCELINIPFHYTVSELTSICYELLDRNNLNDAYIRPLVYCSPNMNLDRPKEVHLLMVAWEWGAYLGDKLLNVKISSFCRPHPRSLKIEAKACGHYLNSILASTEAKDLGYDEALLLDHEGFLAEGPGANLFFQMGKRLYTPAKGNILPGITRQTVLEICNELGVEVMEGKYSKEQLLAADSAFYCGTAAEVVGLKSVNAYSFPLEWKSSIGKRVSDMYSLKVREFNAEAILS
jgi:branched-chain amino acid aminotransferase